MGTPLQPERFCVLDNNHALSIVFAKDCKTCPNKGHGYNNATSSTFMARSKKDVLVQDDGLTVAGYMAMDYMCIGMYGN